MPDETIVVDDLIRGRVEFPAEALDDFVLVRSDGHPLYHFCVCVDDTEMRDHATSSAATTTSPTRPSTSRSSGRSARRSRSSPTSA